MRSSPLARLTQKESAQIPAYALGMGTNEPILETRGLARKQGQTKTIPTCGEDKILAGPL